MSNHLALKHFPAIHGFQLFSIGEHWPRITPILKMFKATIIAATLNRK
jgi:hypothetical protein